MTPAKASQIRARRIDRGEVSNNERRAEVKAEKERQNNKWTIQRLWDDYQEGRASTKSKETDRCRFNKHLAKQLGELEVAELSPFLVRGVRRRLEKSLSPQTVVHTLGLIKRVVNHGVANQLCIPIPFKIDMPKVDNIKTEDLTKAEFQRLWQAIEDDEDPQARTFIKMVLYTGMRRGELFKLQWSDINFERGVITIRSPKGGRSQNIPLNAATKELLLNHETPFPESPFIFPGITGGQRVEIKRPVNRIAARAGLPKGFRPLHGLRHVYASMLASSGKVDLYTLQKLLTHKSPKMTQRYAHLRDETMKRAGSVVIDEVNNVLNSKSEEL